MASPEQTLAGLVNLHSQQIAQIFADLQKIIDAGAAMDKKVSGFVDKAAALDKKVNVVVEAGADLEKSSNERDKTLSSLDKRVAALEKSRK